MNTIVCSCILMCIVAIMCSSAVTTLYCVSQPPSPVRDQHCHQVITLYKVLGLFQSKSISKAICFDDNCFAPLEPVLLRLGSWVTVPMSLAGAVIFLSMLLWFAYYMITRILLAVDLLPSTLRLVRGTVLVVLVLALLTVISAFFYPIKTTLLMILKYLGLLNNAINIGLRALGRLAEIL